MAFGDDLPAPLPGTVAPARRWLSERQYGRIVRVAWGLVLLVILVRTGLSPRHQSVYAADYGRAGYHWFHGQEIYRESHHFLYSPLVAAALVPFGLLPDRVGGIAWRLVSVGAFLAASAAWLRSGLAGLGTVPAPRKDGAAETTAFLLLLPLAVGNVNIGQLNLFVLAAVAGAVLAVQRERWNVAALAIAAGGFLKIYPLAVGLLLVVLYPRQLLWRLAAALGLLFVVSLVLQRPGYVWAEYRTWVQRLGTDDRLEIELASTWRDFGYLLRVGGLVIAPAGYRIMEAAAGGVLAAFCWWGQQLGGWERERLLGAVFYLGCAWMMLFGPATEAATYVVLAVPVCAALVAAWEAEARPEMPGGFSPRLLLTTAYGLLITADGCNSWFRAEARHLFMRTLQPVAALVFVIAVMGWLLRAARRPSHEIGVVS